MNSLRSFQILFQCQLFLVFHVVGCTPAPSPTEIAGGRGAMIDVDESGNFIIATNGYGCCEFLEFCTCFGTALFRIPASGELQRLSGTHTYLGQEIKGVSVASNGRILVLSDRCSLFTAEGASWLTSCRTSAAAPEQPWSALWAGALSDSGEHIVSGLFTDNDFYGFFAQRYSWDGASLGASVSIPFIGQGRAGPLALNHTGAFVATWIDSPPSSKTEVLLARRYDDRGDVSPLIQVNSDAPPSAAIVILALELDSAGAATIVWTNDIYSPEDYGVWVRRISAAGEAEGRSIRLAGADHSSAAAINARGEIALAWRAQTGEFDGDRPRTDVFFRKYTSTGDVVVTPRAAGDTGSSGQGPVVALADDGVALTAWANSSLDEAYEPHLKVFAQRFSSDGERLGVQP